MGLFVDPEVQACLGVIATSTVAAAAAKKRRATLERFAVYMNVSITCDLDDKSRFIESACSRSTVLGADTSWSASVVRVRI
jgi:hypothetical protein